MEGVVGFFGGEVEDPSYDGGQFVDRGLRYGRYKRALVEKSILKKWRVNRI